MQTIIHIIRHAPVAIGMAGQVAGAFSSVLLATGASSPARSKFRTEEFNRLSSGGRDRREVIAGHDEVLDIQAAGLRPTGCFLCFLGEQGFVSAMEQSGRALETGREIQGRTHLDFFRVRRIEHD